MLKDVVRALQMWLDALSSIDGSMVRDFVKRTGIADGVAELVLDPSAWAPTLFAAPPIQVLSLARSLRVQVRTQTRTRSK